MSNRGEILSPEGLRIDGRRWNELRRFKCSISTHPAKDGSSVVEHGNSKVACSVTGPCEPELRSRSSTERAIVHVDIQIAPFSTIDRRKRGRADKRLQEMCIMLERTYQDTILTHLYPRSEIRIELTVLAQDGGVLQDCVNAATLALVDAGIGMVDYVCASTAGCVDADPVLDLNNLEESDIAFLTLATLGESSKLALILMESRTQAERLESLVAVAIAGCHQIRRQMDAVVRQTGKKQLQKISR